MALSIRLATANDCLDVLRWRNDPLTRAMSRNSSPLDEISHCRWFDRALADTARLLLIGEDGATPFAMARFDIVAPAEWEISIVLSPESRGEGRGRTFLKMALSYFYSVNPDHSVLAEIKSDNAISQRLFLAQGFIQIGSSLGMLTYLLKPSS